MSRAKDLIEIFENKLVQATVMYKGQEYKADVVNPMYLFREDGPFWEHTYLIQLSMSNYIVNAKNDSEALDLLIDFLVEYAPGYILTPEEEEEAQEDGSIEDYVQGGNAGDYINEPIMRDQMAEIRPQNVKEIK
jgi:hypothetical protein